MNPNLSNNRGGKKKKLKARGPNYQALIRGLQEELAANGFHTIAESAFDFQKKLIEDPSRWKAALCTRRAGKSYLAGIYLFLVALLNPGCNCLYITLKHDTAKAIMFKDIIQPLAEKHHIDIKVNWNELSISLENGSVVRFLGLDTNPTITNNVLGSFYKLVVIDECASFRYDLYDLINRKLRAALSDQQGTVLLIGTPDNVNDQSYFYQITREDPENRPEDVKAELAMWSVHRWSALDNPHMKDNFQKDINDLLDVNPFIYDDPAFQQMFLGKWTTAHASQVYAYANAKRIGKLVSYGVSGGHPIKNLPGLSQLTDEQIRNGEFGDWSFAMGVDFGFNDPSAIVIVAYNKRDPNLYIVDTFKQAELTASEFAEVIKSYQDAYHVRRSWVDPAAKQMIEDINPRYKLRLIPANKTDKRGQIEMINASFYLGQILIHEDVITATNVPIKKIKKDKDAYEAHQKPKAFSGTAPLMKELIELPWNQHKLFEKKVYEEHSAYDNHLCDALLYVFRESRHYRVKKEEESGPSIGSPEHYLSLFKTRAKRLEIEQQTPWFLKKTRLQ